MKQCVLMVSSGLLLASLSFAQNTGHVEIDTSAPDLLAETKGRPTLRLQDFEQMGVKGNPTVREADALVQRSRAQAKQAGLYPNPSVGYEGDQIRGGDYGGGEQGAFVQQTIVLGGKLGLRRRVFQEQGRENELSADEQRERVKSAVDQAFYTALAGQEMVQIRRKLWKLSEDAVETAHQLANVGQADAPDVLQAEVEAEQAQVDYSNAQQVFIRQFHILSAVVGQPDLPVAQLNGTLEPMPTIDPQVAVRTALQNSPSVKRAQQAVTVAEAQLRSARREPVPDITVRAGLQQNEEAIHPFGPPVGLQGFGTASITLPIFNRNQGNVQAAQAELDRAQAEVSRVQLSLRQSIEGLLQTYLAEQAQAKRYENDMIPRAYRAYQLYLNRYQHMAAAYPQVIVSQRTFFQLQVRYVEALQNVWTSATALQHYALTGGLDARGESTPSNSPLNLPDGANGPER